MAQVNSESSGVELAKDGICHMCTVGCPTKVYVRDGKIAKINVVNEAVRETCPRWTAQLDFIYHPDRLMHPLKRIGERGTQSFQRISWDEALDTVAGGLQKIKDECGAESVVFYISYPKEPRPFFHRLAHAFGSPNYCTESSNCFTATRVAAYLNFGKGYDMMAGQSGMIDPATRCELSWSSSVRNSSPHTWNAYLEAKERGVKHIVVDPRRTQIAEMADLHLQLRPGSDGVLALGLINLIISRGLYDKEFVEKWTVGFQDLKQLAEEYPPQKVEEITQVPGAKLEQAAEWYATIKPAKVRLSAGATTHCTNGVQNHRAVLLLPALTGNLDIPGGNTGMAAPQVTSDITLHERLPGMAPGLGSDRFPIWTDFIEEMQVNVLADRIESSQPYPIKALFAAGLNLTFFPNYNHLVKQLKKLDMIVNLDYFHNSASDMVDIVLPIASWVERPILLTMGAGYMKLLEPIIEPVGECWPEWQIYAELAKRLGFGDEFWGGDYEKCIDHLLEPSGITVEELKRNPEGIRQTVPPRPDKYYEEHGFSTPSGKVEIYSSILEQHGYDPLPVYREPMESPISRPDLAVSYPLVLTSGARNINYTHSQFRNIQRLRQNSPEPLVEINPADAGIRSIRSGDEVVVSSPRGSIRLKAIVTDTILPGVVHVPHHWPGEANVNILANDQTLDPISGFAPFKSQLCQVEKP